MADDTTVEPTPVPFATISDLTRRWPSFDTEYTDLAELLLEEASDFILDTYPDAAAHVRPSTLRRITVALVRRAIEAEMSDSVGDESYQETAGPFSLSTRTISPYGDFVLSPRERQALAGEIPGQKAFEIDLMPSRGSRDILGWLP